MQGLRAFVWVTGLGLEVDMIEAGNNLDEADVEVVGPAVIKGEVDLGLKLDGPPVLDKLGEDVESTALHLKIVTKTEIFPPSTCGTLRLTSGRSCSRTTALESENAMLDIVWGTPQACQNERGSMRKYCGLNETMHAQPLYC